MLLFSPEPQDAVLSIGSTIDRLIEHAAQRQCVFLKGNALLGHDTRHDNFPERVMRYADRRGDLQRPEDHLRARLADGTVMITRHADVLAGLQDWQTFSSKSRPWHDPKSLRPEILLTDDPPKHTRVRAVVANALSPKALETAKHARLPRSFWAWDEIVEMNKGGYWPYTPSTNLLYGLSEALDMLLEQGLPAVFARHQRWAEGVRAAVRAACEMLGLDPLYVANEGKLVAVVPVEQAEAALKVMRAHRLGREAAMIGRVVEIPSSTLRVAAATSDRIRRAKLMNFSISCDHRVVDGWDAASFVQALKRMIEAPALILAP